MSTATVTRLRRRSTPANAPDPQTPIRRARTRLLLGAALAVLGQYRREVVDHLDATIDRLEMLRGWCEGGRMPEWTARYAELLNAACAAPEWDDHAHEYDTAMSEITSNYYTGPVSLCDIALQSLTTMATGAHHKGEVPGTIDAHARAIAEALSDSTPDPNVFEGPLNAFCEQLEAAGIGVRDWLSERVRREMQS